VSRHPLLAILALVLLAACAPRPLHRPAPPPAPAALPAEPTTPPGPPEPAREGPPDIATLLALPDAVPKDEPRARLGNPAFYEVYGQRYTVLTDSRGYLERGVASWYGPDFHGIRTAIGEPYDMYSMTAAHRTLPLPAYARVTNLKNGRTVVVRINDRGPFKANRIIDLSYAAALRLDMVREGTTLVEVQAVLPQGAPLPPPPRPRELWAQAGAFHVEAYASRRRDLIAAAGITGVRVDAEGSGANTLYRVRIGPVDSVEAFDALIARLEGIGISGAILVPY
jgi:rare lipoprotein A